MDEFFFSAEFSDSRRRCSDPACHVKFMDKRDLRRAGIALISEEDGYENTVAGVPEIGEKKDEFGDQQQQRCDLSRTCGRVEVI